MSLLRRFNPPPNDELRRLKLVCMPVQLLRRGILNSVQSSETGQKARKFKFFLCIVGASVCPISVGGGFGARDSYLLRTETQPVNFRCSHS